MLGVLSHESSVNVVSSIESAKCATPHESAKSLTDLVFRRQSEGQPHETLGELYLCATKGTTPILPSRNALNLLVGQLDTFAFGKIEELLGGFACTRLIHQLFGHVAKIHFSSHLHCTYVSNPDRYSSIGGYGLAASSPTYQREAAPLITASGASMGPPPSIGYVYFQTLHEERVPPILDYDHG